LVEHELVSARSASAWALSFGLPAIPFEVLLTLAVLLFSPSF
jgi:hypothetical protein